MVEIFQPGGSGGVEEINGLAGNITLAAGTNITLGTVGNTITINSSGGGSYLLATGATTGATSQSQIFTNGTTIGSSTTPVLGFDNGSGTVNAGLSWGAANSLYLGNGNAQDQSGTLNANTLNSNELNVTQLVTPTAGTFTTATTGGTLAQNTTYYYRVAATDATGTTLAFAEVSKITGNTTATNTITVVWNKVAGATGYKVYGRTTGAELLMATITSGSTLSWVDNGSVTPSGALPTANSTGIVSVTGTPFTGGTATTTTPLFYMNSGTAPTTWSTNGTVFGINAPSGFAGNFLDLHLNGGASLLSINSSGLITANNGMSSFTSLNINGTGIFGGSNAISFSPNANANYYSATVNGGNFIGTESSTLLLQPPAIIPGLISTASTGGTLTGNTTYYYRITSVDANGESLPTIEFSKTTANGTNTNTITFVIGVADHRATSYKLYGRTTGAEQFIASFAISGSTSSYTDTGGITPSGALPTVNTTANNVLGLASPELNIKPITTPVNAAFSSAHNNGALLHATTYYYRVAALSGNGTTLASTETSTTTGSGADDYAVTVNWTAVVNAASYAIYGRTTGAEQLIGYASGAVTSWLDYGYGTPSGALPTVNTTGAIRSAATQTTYSGSTSGSAVWSMPFQGTSYKKFMITMAALNDAGGTVTFPTAFTKTPYCYGDATAIAISSASTTTFTIAAAATITGNVFCEGY